MKHSTHTRPAFCELQRFNASQCALHCLVLVMHNNSYDALLRIPAIRTSLVHNLSRMSLHPRLVQFCAASPYNTSFMTAFHVAHRSMLASSAGQPSPAGGSPPPARGALVVVSSLPAVDSADLCAPGVLPENAQLSTPGFRSNVSALYRLA